jgi:hypothetical protein
MKQTTIFILGLIGSILGILGSLISMFALITFWAGFISGLSGADTSYGFSNAQLGGGFIISLLQSLLTIPIFIISLVKCLPNSLAKNIRNNSIWLLVLGIMAVFVNVFLLVPNVLLIVAGSIGLSQTKSVVNLD